MTENTFEVMEKTTSGSSSIILKVAVLCAAIIAVGLAIGLGVGLSKDPEIRYVTEDTPIENPTDSNKPTSDNPSSNTDSQTIQTPEAVTDPSTEKPTDSNKPTSDNPSSNTGPHTTRTPEPETTTVPPADHGEPWGDIRLPRTIIPSHYKLKLHPNLQDDTFTGENVITMDVKQKTKYVTLHAHPNLNIDASSTVLTKMDGTNIPIEKQFRVSEYQYWVIVANTELELGEYILAMKFDSRMDYTLSGLYVSKYKDPKGNEHKIVSTDMEPSDARRAYPCFDEPNMKINYTSTIVHEGGEYYALSNMPVRENRTLQNGDIETEFHTSIPMPTYLAIFVVCKYGFVESVSSRGVKLRIYAAQHDIDANRADYANTVTKKIMDTFEKNFKMHYHIDKCDQISIPDFTSGAMENWGLITYRETALLWDPKESSTSNKQRVVAVIAHELGHMWFGNTVTTEWWNSLWINEGFASYFEYDGIDAAEPDWNIFAQYVLEVQSAMRSDSSITSQMIIPDEDTIKTPGNSASMFSSITYNKGGSVLRLIRDILGDDLFYGGLQLYLKNNEFQPVTAQDLFVSMQEYIDNNGGVYNIEEMLGPWLFQNGHPLISLTIDDNLEGTLKQQQMLSDPNANLTARRPSDYDYIWPVYVKPFNYNITDNPIDSTVKFDGLSPADPIKLNPGQHGFYRVKYDDKTWNNILNRLQTDHTYFNAMDRSNLVDDAFQLAKAEKIPYISALNITLYMDKEVDEDSYLVWDAFADGTGTIRQMMETTSAYPNIQKYFLSKVKPAADKLGWEVTDGKHMEKLNRYLTLALALRYGDEEAKSNATALFNTWKNSDDKTRAAPDVRSLVYRYGIADGDAGIEQWEFMLKRYQEELVATEKDALLYGLTQVQNRRLITRLLDLSKNTSIIREGDFFTCITRIGYTPLGRNLAWTWYTLNWDYLLKRFGEDHRQLGNLGPTLASYFNTEEMLYEATAVFAATTGNSPGESSRENALNTIQENIEWMKKYQEPISSWIDEQVEKM